MPGFQCQAPFTAGAETILVLAGGGHASLRAIDDTVLAPLALHCIAF